MKTDENQKTVSEKIMASSYHKRIRSQQKINLLLKDLRTFPDDPAFMSEDKFMDFDLIVTELFERMIELRTLRCL